MLVTRDENGKGGVTVPIIKDADLKGKDAAQLYDCRIWVGDQARVREMLAADLAKLDDDGFIIRCVGNDVYVCGKNIWGTHWAPYELLERFAGCRWYMASSKRWWMPQEDGMIGLGDVIPRAAKVQMPADTNIVEEPAYKMRWFMAMPTHSFRERYRDRFHHALVGIMPPQKYGQAHPEYYPEIKGKRCVPAENHAQDFQPCISNPAVVDLLANAAIEHFDTNPDQNSFSVGMNDSANYCECSPCQGMAPADITEKNARIAYSFFVFYNRVAEKVARRHPDKRLGCLS
jgi:hypothetical protein